MKKIKYFTITILSFVASIIAITVNTNEAHSFQKQSLSGQAYVDPKGFFKIFPPSGWRIREYPNDPRGKVAFIHPDINNLNLRIIAQGKAFSSFEELSENTEKQANKLRSKFDGQVSIKRTSLGDTPALMIKVTIPGQFKHLQFQFLRGRMYYSITYAAPINMYEDFLTIATLCIDTFEPTLRDVTQKDIIRHSISSKMRIATLLIQEGRLNDALETINEGLEIDPTNSKLMGLKRLIEEKRK
ncbi:MAG: hypothetical protein KAV87_64525 [Desulfobacteraceae bacterium]|nr:hypothetical protein [Desulfobacteraceae bacterium]